MKSSYEKIVRKDIGGRHAGKRETWLKGEHFDKLEERGMEQGNEVTNEVRK